MDPLAVCHCRPSYRHHLLWNLTRLLVSGLEMHFSGTRYGKELPLVTTGKSVTPTPCQGLHESQEQPHLSEDFTHVLTHTQSACVDVELQTRMVSIYSVTHRG